MQASDRFIVLIERRPLRRALGLAFGAAALIAAMLTLAPPAQAQAPSKVAIDLQQVINAVRTRGQER